MNKAILSGRIASEIELKNAPSGVSVCSFRIAVNRRFKNAEGEFDTDFISCVAWRSNAEFISKYFQKGNPIELVGSIQTRSYEKDGQKAFVTEVVVDESGFVIGNKKEDSNTAPSQADTMPSFSDADGFVTVVDDDDLPF